MNKQCGTEVDVLYCMSVTLDTSHSPIAPYDDDAHAEPSPELPTHEFTAVFKAALSAGVNTACTTSTINTVAANKNHTIKMHERRPPVRVLPRRVALSNGIILSVPVNTLVLVWTVFLVPSSQHATNVETPVGGDPSHPGGSLPTSAAVTECCPPEAVVGRAMVGP